MSNSIQHVGKRPASTEFETSVPKRQNTRFNTMDASDDPTAEKVEKINFEQRVTPSSAYFEMNNYKKALQHFSRIVNSQDQDAQEINYYMGCCHFQLGDRLEAIEHFKKVFESHSKFHETQYLLGCSYFLNCRVDELQESFQSFEKIPSTNRRFADAQIMLATICQKQQKRSESISYSKAALESKFSSDENIARAHFLLGKAMYYEEDYEHAIEHLKNFDMLNTIEDFNDISSRMRETQEFLGMCYLKLGKYDKAVKYFNTDLELIPLFLHYVRERHSCYYHSAVCLEKLGKLKEAVTMLKKAARLEGQYQNEVQNMLDELT